MTSFILFTKIIYLEQEIKQVLSNTNPSFINNTETVGHCMDIIGAALKPDHIENLKKYLDKAKVKKLS